MFTINDFLKLMRYFRGLSVTNLDNNLLVLAESTKAKTTNLFNENLDLPCHSSDDYKRLKEFLISWYSSLKTLSSVNLTDVRSLPDEHVNELLYSFGYTNELDKISKENKINFFYDLVNLYKIKGTPESIERALSYFGIPDVEILEYWLQYDSSRNLVFHPTKVNPPIVGQPETESQDLDFDYVYNSDPHWMLTKEQVNQLFLTNRISFPSKSPYFGIQPISDLSGEIINPVLAILVRLIQDQYDDYISGSTPVENINTLNVSVSLLQLYLALVYTYNSLYGKTIDSKDSSVLYYNGSMSLSNQEIIDLYQSITSRSNSKTRDEIKQNLILYEQYFTRSRTNCFLTDINTAGIILEENNPNLKSILDSNIVSNNGDDIIKELLQTLSVWIVDNINSYSPSLLNIVIGFSATDYVKQIINFFKPYRSRLIIVDNIYKIENPLFDSVLQDDAYSDVIKDYFVDFDTANSEPGYPEGFTYDSVYAVRSTPPIGENHRVFNMYMDSTGTARVTYETLDTTSLETTYVYSDPPVGGYRIYNIFLEYGISPILHIVYEEEANELEGSNPTVVESIPPNLSFYRILNVYLNELILFTMDYTEFVPESWPIDSTSRIYYSRSTYDCNSYFDIGASSDYPPSTISLEIENNIYDIYNYHTDDSTSYVHINYIGDSTGEDYYAMQDGGFVDFDGCGVFDAPPISDICKIYVIPVT